jgi:Zn-dependent protease with chaperone function
MFQTSRIALIRSSHAQTEVRGEYCKLRRRSNASSLCRLMVRRALATILLLETTLTMHERANATGVPLTFNVQAQTACEVEMLGGMDAREVSSGKAYDVLTEVARAYGRPIPHIYIFPGGWNMAYVAASAAVDGRGKIVVGQQSIGLFDAIALEGFLGHEMAHLASDRGAKGCNDYIVRDPQMEADADALAARTLGSQPVKAFLERVLAITEGQNSEAQRRLAMLTKSSEISATSSGPLRSAFLFPRR